MTVFGDALRARRRAAGLSQRTLSELSDIAQSHIGMLESGYIGQKCGPRQDTVERLARALGCAPDDFPGWVRRKDRPAPAPRESEEIVWERGPGGVMRVRK